MKVCPHLFLTTINKSKFATTIFMATKDNFRALVNKRSRLATSILSLLFKYVFFYALASSNVYFRIVRARQEKR